MIPTSKFKTKSSLRATILISLLMLYLTASSIFENLIVEHKNEYTFRFTTPLPESVFNANNLTGSAEVTKVLVTGFFSNWDTQSEQYFLTQVSNDVWEITLELAPGDNQYKFVFFVDGHSEPFWMVDPSADFKVQDSWGNYNGVARIPDYEEVQFIFNATLLVVSIFILLYYLLEPLLFWLMRRRLPFKLKLTVAMTIVVVASNVVFTLYSIYEIRQTVRQGVVDDIHMTHLVLQSEGIDFDKLTKQQERISFAMRKLLWDAHVRVEKKMLSASQITLSDLAVFDNNLNLLTLNHRQQNQELQEFRASMYGYSNLQDYFLQGIFQPLIVTAKANTRQRKTLFDNPIDKTLTDETTKTKLARQLLGFSTFLHPIVINDRVAGYYGGTIQVKLYGGEIERIIKISLLFILFIAIVTYLLLANIGQLVTGYLAQLNVWTKQIITGNFDQHIILDSNDEIQSLAQDMDVMRQSLKSNFLEIEEKNKQLQLIAYTDVLTELPNRSKLYADYHNIPPESLCLFNIDSFKGINDVFGHELGDQVLIEVAQRLRILSQGFSTTTLYRIDSDEFAIANNKEYPQHQIESVLMQVAAGIVDTQFTINNNEFYVSVTAGIAMKKENSSVQAMQSQAELALISAKSELVPFMFYQPDMASKQTFDKNMAWTQRIRQAIDDNRIVPYFQPIINNQTQEIEKYECLVRLLEPGGNVISPHAFLDISKSARFYPLITQIMLEKSFEIFDQVDTQFSINLSIEDILNTRTNNRIFQLIKDKPNTANRVTFEIVESAEIKNYEALQFFIKQVKTHGCKISIDDFGSGYSNFAYILSMNVDFLKIDGSLIRNIDKDNNSQIIVETICQFAEKMNIKTIAEFVHSEAIQEKIMRFKINYSQGYYFGKPENSLKQK